MAMVAESKILRFEPNDVTKGIYDLITKRPNRVLLVADVSNLYYCVRNRFSGRKLDYYKLLRVVPDFGHAEIRAIAYGSTLLSGGVDKAQGFKDHLENLGFETKYKEARTYAGGKTKCNSDIEMALDIFTMINWYDTLVLASADGDFVPCINFAKSRGKQCLVVGSYINQDLKLVADNWIEIGENLLERIV